MTSIGSESVLNPRTRLFCFESEMSVAVKKSLGFEQRTLCLDCSQGRLVSSRNSASFLVRCSARSNSVSLRVVSSLLPIPYGVTLSSRIAKKLMVRLSIEISTLIAGNSKS